MVFFQVDAGFFNESDVKIVAKSIRDRVALIQWRRERIWPLLQSEDQRDSENTEKAKIPQAQQVQVTYLSHTGHHVLSEPEEPESDQHISQQNLPTSVTSLACKLSCMCILLVVSAFSCKSIFEYITTKIVINVCVCGLLQLQTEWLLLCQRICGWHTSSNYAGNAMKKKTRLGICYVIP